jgi:hypothetical protein
MMQRRISQLIFSGFGLTLPAAAATYNYYLQVPAMNSLSAWSVSWQRNSLTPPSCGTGSGGIFTSFVSNGEPLGGFNLTSLQFCQSSDGSVAFFANWALPSKPSVDFVYYGASFPASEPPLSPGVFSSATIEAIFGPGGPFPGVPGTGPGPAATLTISKFIPVPPVPRWSGSIVRVSLTAGPVTPAPGTPVEANVGFVDVNGNSLGQFPPIQIIPGQASSFELSPTVSPVAVGQHTQVVPVVNAPEGKALPPLQLTTEVFDSSTGYGAVLTTVTGLAPPAASFAPQGLAGGQTMQLTATASPAGPCLATLSFANAQGIAIGPSLTVNLNPGHSQSLDLTGAMLNVGIGTNVIVQPMVELQAPIGAVAFTGESACMVASDVFDPIGGRTSTYQIANVQ